MLKIKNPTDILGMNFVGGKYTLREAEEHDDSYCFSFQDAATNWVIIYISRKPEWDSDHNRNMYRVDNGTMRDHRVSAEWFGMIKNVQFTFNEALKDL
jgi:hypothetical protein